MDTALQNASVAGFAFCLLWAAVSDARGFRIPNRAVIGIAALFPIHILARASTAVSAAPLLADGAFAFALAGIVLLAGFGLFALHYIGGGDAKLAAATALWAGPNNILPFLIMAGLTGGILATGVLLWRVAFPEAAAANGPLRTRLYQGLTKPVPFGVAIAAAGLFVAARLTGV